jgi:hypothetical protein
MTGDRLAESEVVAGFDLLMVIHELTNPTLVEIIINTTLTINTIMTV